ncbi:hypothetical protein [Glycomyces tenuis]|uniref:hypothetical protein n=1 Tax=Glycomyces tenuis TaxID=58116 RepID=UPI00047AA714|nr:hypothetical protein [Glycomyces tenuis]
MKSLPDRTAGGMRLDATRHGMVFTRTEAKEMHTPSESQRYPVQPPPLPPRRRGTPGWQIVGVLGLVVGAIGSAAAVISVVQASVNAEKDSQWQEEFLGRLPEKPTDEQTWSLEPSPADGEGGGEDEGASGETTWSEAGYYTQTLESTYDDSGCWMNQLNLDPDSYGVLDSVWSTDDTDSAADLYWYSCESDIGHLWGYAGWSSVYRGDRPTPDDCRNSIGNGTQAVLENTSDRLIGEFLCINTEGGLVLAEITDGYSDPDEERLTLEFYSEA